MTNKIESEIIKELILPAIEKEVNEGTHFAQLRQIYHSLILAAWFKRRLKQSLLGQAYVDQNKVRGVDHQQPNAAEKIYQQYLKAYQQGVYDYIKEEYDPYAQTTLPRKYFSGGASLNVEQSLALMGSAGIIFQKQVQWGEFQVIAPVLIPDHPVNDNALLASVREVDFLMKRVQYLRDLRDKIANDDLPQMLMFGDKHGRVDDLEILLQKVQERAEQGSSTPPLLVIGHGDYFDRGDQNVRVFEILQELVAIAEENEPIQVELLLGNHDIMLINAALFSWDVQKWLDSNGGKTTSTEFQKSAIPLKEPARWLVHQARPLFFSERGFLHVHAGVWIPESGAPRLQLDDLKSLDQEWMTLQGKSHEEDQYEVLKKMYGILIELDEEGIFTVRRENWLNHLEEKSALDRFLAEFGVYGLVFGHDHHDEILNIDNRIFGIDVDDLDPGHVVVDPQGLRFYPAKRGRESFDDIFEKESFLTTIDGEVQRRVSSILEEIGKMLNFGIPELSADLQIDGERLEQLKDRSAAPEDRDLDRLAEFWENNREDISEGTYVVSEPETVHISGEDPAMIVNPEQQGGIAFQTDHLDIELKGKGMEVCTNEECQANLAKNIEQFKTSFQGFQEIRIVNIEDLPLRALPDFLEIPPEQRDGFAQLSAVESNS